VKLIELAKSDYLSKRESKLTLFDKFVFRPVGILIIYLLSKIFKLSPNFVTLLSVIVTVAGSFFFIIKEDVLAMTFFILFPILDCADGTLARFLKVKKGVEGTGVLVDALGGYCFIVIFWSTLEYSFDNGYYSLFCHLILVINLICRLYLNKKLLILAKKDEKTESPRSSFIYNCYENIEFGSAMIPLFGIALMYDTLHYFVMAYLLVAMALLAWCMYDMLKLLQS